MDFPWEAVAAASGGMGLGFALMLKFGMQGLNRRVELGIEEAKLHLAAATGHCPGCRCHEQKNSD